MSELREELERRLKEYENKTLEQVPEENSADLQTDNEHPAVSAVVVIHAPKGYAEEFAADFKNLSPAWQEYLSRREDELAEEIGRISARLQQYSGLEELYERRADHLQKMGLSCIQEWLEGLACLDEAMEANPQQTLLQIASCYGLCHPDMKSCCHHEPVNSVVMRLGKLERDYGSLASYLRQQKTRELTELVNMFATQKDSCGELLHPYLADVRAQVLEFLNNGTAFDVADAYEKAVWVNPFVREKLIKNIISAQTTEAQKAKKASFAPKGKSEAPQRELTLREEIQKNLAAFSD